MYLITNFYGGAKRPPRTSSLIHAAEAAAVAAAAPAAASVSEEQNSWTLNIISFLDFVNLLLHMGVTDPD